MEISHRPALILLTTILFHNANSQEGNIPVEDNTATCDASLGSDEANCEACVGTNVTVRFHSCPREMPNLSMYCCCFDFGFFKGFGVLR
uniref:Uncharacterized protein n=1 Tax=Tetraselmis sp. GSL018 TaxID=582737 RepID=A0A061R8I5_9CHLO